MKFLVDENLGKLAKWLRILGYDAEMFRSSKESSWLERKEGGLVILTKSRKLFSRKSGEVDILLIKHDKVFDQLKEIIDRLSISLDPESFFSRCIHCNMELAPVAKEKVKTEVPAFVWDSYELFYECGKCHRIYWPGSHKARMEEFIRAHIPDRFL